MTFALVLAAALAVGAALPAPASAEIGAPAIRSDKPDYAPGETVTLNGDGWSVGEVVHINVNDNVGQTWSRDVDVVAGFDGTITDQFNLPDWFVAVYTVTATGLSGTATTTFTDGNIRVASAPSGVTFTLTWQKFNGLNCAGTVIESGTEFNVGSAGGARFTKGAGNTESIRWVAAATATTPSGRVFRMWVAPNSDPFTANFGGDRHAVCTNGFTGNGTRDYVARYNTAPAVTPPANQSANEGASASFNLGSFSDAEADSPWAVTVNWGDGSPASTFTKTTTGSLGSLAHAYADNGSYTVTITVAGNGNGSGGASGSATFTVAVANVAPTVSYTSAPASADEGQRKTYAFSVSDPGQDTYTPSSGYPDCGSGGSLVAGSFTISGSSGTQTGSFQCDFLDGPANPNVSIRFTDSDGASGNTASQAVTVSNVAPTVTLSGANAADESETKTYTFSVSDPGQDTFSVSAGFPDCGTAGTLVGGSLTTNAGGGSFDCRFWDGPASPTVSIQVRDSDEPAGSTTADSNVASRAVSVANVAPTVSMSGPSVADEGQSKTYTFSVSDPGQDTFSVAGGFPDCGTGGSLTGGSLSTTASGGTFSCSFPDGPASPSVRIKVEDSDGAASNVDSIAVTVSNVAPTVSLSGANSADEGQTKSYSFTVSDPGADSFAVAAGFPDCGTGGSLVGGSLSTNASGGSFQCSFADGPASPLVRVKVEDSDGAASNVDSIGVTVSNVAPTVTLSGANAADESQSKTYGFSVSDPGQDTFTVAAGYPDCGSGGSLVSGSLSTSASGGSFDCSFPDGPANPNVRVKVDDSDGAGSNVDSVAVTVHNVAPTVTLSASNDLSVNEGSTHTYSYSISDPGVDTVSAVVTSCSATGAKVGGSDSFANSSGSFQCSFVDGPNSSTVSAAATDSDSDTGAADTQPVTVDNVAPTVSISGAASVNEGSTHAYSFTVSDPGDDTFSVSSGYPTCGTGGSVVSGSLVTSASGGSFDCSFPDGPATTNVAIKVADSDGASDVDSEAVQIVQVANVAPSLTPAAAQTSDEGESHPFALGSFSDDGVGDGPWAVAVNWGDGSPLTSFSVSSMGSLGSHSHSYADGPATHTVTVTVTDKDGDSGSAGFVVTVANVAPTVSLSGANAADEGQTKTYSFSVSDPGADSFSVAAGFPDCGTGGSLVGGSLSTNASGGSFDCSFPDGPAAPSVRIKVEDSDGAVSNVDSVAVTVSNVAPTVSLSGANAADEGQTKTYSFTVSDPGQDGFSVAAGFPDCGTGGELVPDSLSTTASGGSFDCSFPDGPASPSVRIKVEDSDGAAANVDSVAVTVSNVAPTVALSGAANVGEGSTHTYSFAVTDPGQDTFTVSSGYPSCGTGGSVVSGSLMTDWSGGSFDCHFPDGPATTNVAIKVADSDGASDTDSEAVQIVQVANLAPSVTAAANQSSDEGESHPFSMGSFSDDGVGDGPWVVSVNWGDGSPMTSFSVTSMGSLGSKSHTYADGPATHTVTVKVTDKDGDSGSASFVVTVDNVAPTVSLSGANAADEGQTKTYSFSVSDPGADSFSVAGGFPDCGTGGDLVAGSFSTTASGGSFQCSFPDGPASPSVRVKVEDSDGAASNVDSLAVTVSNVAPTVSLSGANAADEGQTKSYSFTVSDPGADSFSVAAGFPDCGTGGSLVSGSLSTTASGGSFDCSFPDGPASPSVRVKVEDSDGAASNVDSVAVTVSNVAPTVSLSGANAADEGQTKTYSFTVSDPGADSFTVAAGFPDCGTGGDLVAGSLSTNASGGSFQCSFPDGPASPSVRVKVEDSDGAASNVDSLAVAVSNVAPTVSLSGANAANEGQAKTYTFLVTDPGTDSFTFAAGFPDCGTGGDLVSGSLSANASGGSFQCSFPDGPASPSVRVKVEDSDGAASNVDSIAVTVSNVAPTVTLSGAANVNEGSTHTYSFTVTDPGQDTFSVSSGYPSCGTGGTYVPGSLSTNASGGSFDCSFPDGPATTNVAIKVADSDGASDTDSEAVQIVQVANLAPSVSAAADQSSDEGESHSFALGSFTDNGEDDAPWDVSVAWGDGSPVTSFTVTSTGSLGARAHTYADGAATHTVTVKVTDKDGSSDSNSFQATVKNVAPTVSFTGGPTSVDEGQTATYGFSVSDPGQDGFTVKDGYPDCGSGGSLVAGSLSTNAGGGSFDCSFADGPASPTVSVQVRDADEPAGSSTADSNVATRSVAVANVAPAVSFTSGATSADEAETKTYSFSVSDPGDDTYAATAGYPNCGTGGSLVSGSYSVSGNSGAQTGSFQCSFPDGPASPDVQVRFTDSDGDAGNVASRSVSVSNVAPSATFNAPSSVDEGSDITVSLTNPGDPSSVDTTVGFTYAFDCGDGSGYGAFGPANSRSCPTNDNGTRTVKGKIRDKDGGEREYTKQVAVGNLAPQVNVTSPAFGKLYAKPATVAMSASFTDAGKGDTHTCSVNWDDGTSSAGTVTESQGAGTCTASHSYNTAGVYTIKVTVTDDDGASTTVEWMVVVYDPSAGFVTGGGWIDVAGGSYPADPTLAGRANFGFTSKYKNGASTPTGETEFNFQVASFKFHSTSYQWLVVSGYKAQYKGTGAVNGVPGYEFRLTAYDGALTSPASSDKFRIKITKQSTGEIVFDNRVGKSDDIDAADPQAITGGSIVIHKA